MAAAAAAMRSSQQQQLRMGSQSRQPSSAAISRPCVLPAAAVPVRARRVQPVHALQPQQLFAAHPQQQQQQLPTAAHTLLRPRQQRPLHSRQHHQQQQAAARVLLCRSSDAPAPQDAAADSSGGLDPSIPAVDQDFDLLGAEVRRLSEELGAELKGCSVYLVGMMGSGKSTTGKMLANTLKYAFFDVDNVIERAHPGESVADIFSKYGEDYFRQCEEQVLKELAPYKSLVVATGGGAVTRPKNWSFMHNGVVAWLRGAPELLARRVVAEGLEKRPLLFGEGVTEGAAYEISLAKLTSLLEARTKYYENADVEVDLRGYGKDEAAGAPTAVVMHRLMDAILAKIRQTTAEREARRQFTIERSGVVDTMRTQPSPAAQQQQQQAEGQT